ncbi:hypothetical protein T484DRAFT_1966838 [Baffinella frigidus]|nr:hypothetical protein T484DRAFT_1966838 [Cryptophyta sp. CCMP2293]
MMMIVTGVTGRSGGGRTAGARRRTGVGTGGMCGRTTPPRAPRRALCCRARGKSRTTSSRAWRRRSLRSPRRTSQPLAGRRSSAPRTAWHASERARASPAPGLSSRAAPGGARRPSPRRRRSSCRRSTLSWICGRRGCGRRSAGASRRRRRSRRGKTLRCVEKAATAWPARPTDEPLAGYESSDELPRASPEAGRRAVPRRAHHFCGGPVASLGRARLGGGTAMSRSCRNYRPSASEAPPKLLLLRAGAALGAGRRGEGVKRAGSVLDGIP